MQLLHPGSPTSLILLSRVSGGQIFFLGSIKVGGLLLVDYPTRSPQDAESLATPLSCDVKLHLTGGFLTFLSPRFWWLLYPLLLKLNYTRYGKCSLFFIVQDFRTGFVSFTLNLPYSRGIAAFFFWGLFPFLLTRNLYFLSEKGECYTYFCSDFYLSNKCRYIHAARPLLA